MKQLLIAIARQAQYQIDYQAYRDCWLPAIEVLSGIPENYQAD